MSPTRMTTLAVLLLELSHFVLFFKLIWCPLCNLSSCNLNTLRNILMVFGRNVEQDEKDNMLHTRMTTLPFLLLLLSPFIIFDSYYALILCLLW